MLKNRIFTGGDRYLVVLVAFTVLIIFFLGITLGCTIFNQRTITSMMLQVAEFGVIAIAMSMCVLIGAIDLSIVTNANLAGIIAAKLMTGAWFPVDKMSTGLIMAMGIFAIMSVTILCGLINGILIAKVSINPIVATLATMTLYQGIAMAISVGKIVSGFPTQYTALGVMEAGPFPVLFLIMVTVMLCIAWILANTPFGKKMYLIGENSVAARFSGIENEKVIISVYVVVGVLAGIAAILITARANSAKVGYGSSYVLQAMLVAVLGGFNPSGGRGKIIGIALAIMCIQMLQTAFTIWQFTPYTNKLIWGAMLIAVMLSEKALNRYQVRKMEKESMHQSI